MVTHPISTPGPAWASNAFPWRVHGALHESGSRLDHKAAVVLAHQGGAFALGITVTPDRGSPLAVAALSLLVVGMCLTTWTLFPRLGSATELARESDHHLIYFGHLRTWDGRALSQRLTGVRPEEEATMLAAQLVALSRINWRKHRLLQASAGLTVLAMGLGTAALAGLEAV